MGWLSLVVVITSFSAYNLFFAKKNYGKEQFRPQGIHASHLYMLRKYDAPTLIVTS